jgi:hypothetical protein
MRTRGDIKKTNGAFLRQTANRSASINLGGNGGFISEIIYAKRFGRVRSGAVATFSL